MTLVGQNQIGHHEAGYIKIRHNYVDYIEIGRNWLCHNIA